MLVKLSMHKKATKSKCLQSSMIDNEWKQKSPHPFQKFNSIKIRAPKLKRKVRTAKRRKADQNKSNEMVRETVSQWTWTCHLSKWKVPLLVRMWISWKTVPKKWWLKWWDRAQQTRSSLSRNKIANTHN